MVKLHFVENISDFDETWIVVIPTMYSISTSSVILDTVLFQLFRMSIIKYVNNKIKSQNVSCPVNLRR